MADCLASIESTGAIVYRPVYWCGAGLLIAAVWVGLAGGYVLRRRRSLRAAVAGGAALSAACVALSFGLFAFSIIWPPR